MFGIGTQEILLILLIVLLLFGGKKIPELMKGLGKGVKSFRDGMSGLETPQDKAADPTVGESGKKDGKDTTAGKDEQTAR